MKKSLIAFAALATIAGAASAQSSVTLYGRVDLSVGKDSGGSSKYMANGSGSRFGVRGVEDLGGGMSAFFNLEHRFDADTGAQSAPTRFWTGRSLVGLQGGFGKLTLGREYTTAFLGSQLVADPWGWDTVVASTNGARLTLGDFYTGTQFAALTAAQKAALGIASTATTATTLIGFGGTVGITGVGGIAQVRNDSSLTYNFSAAGFSFGAQIAEANDTLNNFAKRPINFSLGYAAGPLSIGLGYEATGRKASGPLFLAGGVGSGKKESVVTVNGAFDMGAVKLGAFIGSGHSAVTDVKHKSWMVTAVSPMGQGEFRAAYGRLSADGEKINTVLAAGYHYAMSKRTTVYADFVRNTGDGRADLGLSQPSKVGYDFGIKHNF